MVASMEIASTCPMCQKHMGFLFGRRGFGWRERTHELRCQARQQKRNAVAARIASSGVDVASTAPAEPEKPTSFFPSEEVAKVDVQPGSPLPRDERFFFDGKRGQEVEPELSDEAAADAPAGDSAMPDVLAVPEEVNKVTAADGETPVEEAAPTEPAATAEEKVLGAEEAAVVQEVAAPGEQAQEVHSQESVTEETNEPAETAEENVTQEAPSLEVIPSEEQAEVVQAEELVTEQAKKSFETLKEKATVPPSQLPAVDELSPSQQDPKEQLADITESREVASPEDADGETPVEEAAPIESAATSEQKVLGAEEASEVAQEVAAEVAAEVVQEVVASQDQAQEVKAQEHVTEEVKGFALALGKKIPTNDISTPRGPPEPEEKVTAAPSQLPGVDELSPSQQDEKEQLANIKESREVASFASAASQPASFTSATGSADVREQHTANAAKRRRGGRGGSQGKGKKGSGKGNQW